MKNNNQGRIIHWDAKKTGSKLGEPFRYGPTLREYREKNGLISDEWQKAKKQFLNVVEVSVSEFKVVCDKSFMKHLKRAYNDLGGLQHDC